MEGVSRAGERAQFSAGWLCRDAVTEGWWIRFGNCVDTISVKEVYKGEYRNFFPFSTSSGILKCDTIVPTLPSSWWGLSLILGMIKTRLRN